MTDSKLRKEIIKKAMEEYVNSSVRTRSATKIAEKYGINRKTLLSHLHKNGIEVTMTKTKYNLKEDVFDVIDTEEKAYWLGFLYADGYVMSKNNNVGLSLSKNDLEHLIKFKNFIGWDGDIKIYETHQFGTKDVHNKAGEVLYVARVEVGSKQMHESLVKHGCVPNKSLILKFPDLNIFSDEALVIPFIRGYFDGDGTLGLYKHSKTNPNLEESLMFVGTKDFLEGVQKYLGNGFLMQKKNCSDETYRLSYSTAKANKAAEIMYSNATIYLDRKYKIYEQFAAKKSSKIGKSCDANTEVSLEIAKGFETP